MWTSENRARYDRSHLRYPSDLTDDEWKLVELLIPPRKRGGDKRTESSRDCERPDEGDRFSPPRFNRAHAEKTMQSCIISPDRL